MNTVDIFILLPLLWGAHKGYQTGAVMTLISTISFFLAIVLGFKFFHFTLQLIAPHTDLKNSAMPYVAFIVTFLVIWFVINRLGNYLKGMLDSTVLGSFDSLIGAGFGVLKFAFFVSIFLWLFNSLKTFDNSLLKGSLLFPVIEPVAPYLVGNASKIMLMGQDIIEDTKKIINQSQPNQKNNPQNSPQQNNNQQKNQRNNPK